MKIHGNKGRKFTEEHKKKISDFRKSFTYSEESKKKMSLGSTGNKNCVGRIISEETKNKMRKAKLGKRASLETRKKMSESRMGEKNWKWNPNREVVENTEYHRGRLYSQWTRAVKKRDNFKCKISNQDCKGNLESHHILSWKDHPILRYNLNNGIALCEFHHPTKSQDEIKLSPFFQELIKQRNDQY